MLNSCIAFRMSALLLIIFSAEGDGTPNDSSDTVTSERGHLMPTTTLQPLTNDQEDSCSITCSEVSADTCPPAFFCKQGHCECGNFSNNMIKCYNKTSLLLSNYCATFNGNENVTAIGLCVYTSFLEVDGDNKDLYYNILPENVQELSNSTCGPYNRAGTLCGECLTGHYPLAYSYNMTCIPCPHVHWNWFRYIMAAYLPLTLFYIIIVLFKINTTSSHLFAMVYFCQNLSMPVFLRVLLISVPKSTNSLVVHTVVKVLVSLCGIWNLDFFRPFYSDICLGLDVLPTLASDYAIAVYPLLLMIITYFLISMYDRKYWVIIIMWKPFHNLFSLFKKNWDVRTSVIDAFATFFLLSNVKFLSVSLDLLSPAKVYQLRPDQYSTNYTGLYYAGNIQYFGRDHLPYAVLALVTLCIFVLFSVLVLALYPFQFFQKLLNLFPARWYILHTFMDAFQGCYKDGTQPGTRDCRWFASTFFFFRFCNFVVFYLTQTDLRLTLIVISFLLHNMLLIAVQPFKHSVAHYTAINAAFLQFVALFTISVLGIDLALLLNPSLIPLLFTFVALLAVSPIVYLITVVVYWVYKHKRFGLDVMQQLRAWRNGYRLLHDHVPDKIKNSGSYSTKNLAKFPPVVANN